MRVGGLSPGDARDAIADWTAGIVNDESARSREVSGVFVLGYPPLPHFWGESLENYRFNLGLS
jgi:hypothetical protein